MLTYGSQGSGLGAKQQVYLEKLAMTEVAQKTIWDRFATKQYDLPQNSGKKIKFRKWVPMKDLIIANDIYKNYTGNDVINAGQGIVTMVGENEWQNFVLAEGSSGNEVGDMKVVELETDINLVGSFMKVTEETQLLHDMYTLKENIRQYSDWIALVVDGFYRDVIRASAGHVTDITGNAAPDNDVISDAFTKAVKKISTMLKLSGAQFVDSVLTQSPRYAKQGIYSRYIGVCNTLFGEALQENPNFRPVEEYPGNIKLLENEIGMLGTVRVIEDPNGLITDNGDGTYTGELVIFGKEHTADIPLRGKKRIEIVYKGLGENGDDPLNRISTLGWKSWLGAYTINPERVGKVIAKFTA
jgi:N4-gp56 family major capsid protein